MIVKTQIITLKGGISKVRINTIIKDRRKSCNNNSNTNNNNIAIKEKYFKLLDRMSVLCLKGYQNKVQFHLSLIIIICQYRIHCMMFQVILKITPMLIIKIIIIKLQIILKVVIIVINILDKLEIIIVIF